MKKKNCRTFLKVAATDFRSVAIIAKMPVDCSLGQRAKTFALHYIEVTT